MQAIEAKFLGPTETKGARVEATCDAGSVTVGYHDHNGPSQVEAFRVAVEALVRKLGWSGRWVLGGVKGGGYVAVCVKTYGFTPGRKDRRYTVVFS